MAINLDLRRGVAEALGWKHINPSRQFKKALVGVEPGGILGHVPEYELFTGAAFEALCEFQDKHKSQLLSFEIHGGSPIDHVKFVWRPDGGYTRNISWFNNCKSSVPEMICRAIVAAHHKLKEKQSEGKAK